METIYGNISDTLISENIVDLISQVYKLLPYKEENYEGLDLHFSNILLRLSGLSHVINNSPELITVISILEAARTENNFYLYRKAILDSCSILERIRENYNA